MNAYVCRSLLLLISRLTVSSAYAMRWISGASPLPPARRSARYAPAASLRDTHAPASRACRRRARSRPTTVPPSINGPTSTRLCHCHRYFFTRASRAVQRLPCSTSRYLPCPSISLAVIWTRAPRLHPARLPRGARLYPYPSRIARVL
ncbi:hypothetical protein FA95DRAFT_614741 [Auriscalpium vulgare]|uniref:Uncharacterized protein n=1 Tax=Auriscalpium vulgare TaxID=40419 RepID=A0ACB8RDC0_9AGAM|nr:hypothetical protein FA95DRAFT_614741 [Auriscalpium vulgare]